MLQFNWTVRSTIHDVVWFKGPVHFDEDEYNIFNPIRARMKIVARYQTWKSIFSIAFSFVIEN